MPAKKYGAFNGVFVPTFLSIIGVILYLRLGYIVGAAGIAGAIMIILLAVSVTLSTGLALSSIVTTIRIGSGGAYSIISKTLGLEVGGSVGIPLYLAQVFSVVLYIFGFAEAWNYLFPSHPKLLVVLGIMAFLFTITIFTTTLAIRTQLLVFGIVILSLISIFTGGNLFDTTFHVPLIGSFRNTSFWSLYALFFPAVTGLMAGIGLSGELSDPKRQIPKGVLAGLGITTLIYIIMVLWLGKSSTAAQLLQNNLILINLARFGPIVLIGILAATFSSALTTFVAAPRLLQALGENSILPYSAFFSKIKNGEPQNAIIFTSLIIIGALTVGSLNSIAPILTMFFLLTYAMINVSVFIEQFLGLVSFRPTFSVPKIVSLYGAVSSIIMMFLINVVAGLISLILLVATYLALVGRKLEQKEGDVRSGLFLTMAEWAAKKAVTLPESTKHIWKPNILIPVVRTRTLLGNFPLIKSIVYPNGTLTVLGLDLSKTAGSPEDTDTTQKQRLRELHDLPRLVNKFGEEGIFTFFSKVKVKNYTDGICIALEAIKGQVFHPNILFLPFKPNHLHSRSLARLFKTAKERETGVILFDRDVDIGLGSQEEIHVWLPDEVLDREFYEDRPFDLAMLVAYSIYRNWQGKMTLWMCTSKRREAEAKRYLKKLIYEARFPPTSQLRVSTASITKTLEQAPQGDIHILPFSLNAKVSSILILSQEEKKTFLFVSDSTKEDILA